MFGNERDARFSSCSIGTSGREGGRVPHERGWDVIGGVPSGSVPRHRDDRLSATHVYTEAADWGDCGIFVRESPAVQNATNPGGITGTMRSTFWQVKSWTTLLFRQRSAPDDKRTSTKQRVSTSARSDGAFEASEVLFKNRRAHQGWSLRDHVPSSDGVSVARL